MMHLIGMMMELIFWDRERESYGDSSTNLARVRSGRNIIRLVPLGLWLHHGHHDDFFVTHFVIIVTTKVWTSLNIPPGDSDATYIVYTVIPALEGWRMGRRRMSNMIKPWFKAKKTIGKQGKRSQLREFKCFWSVSVTVTPGQLIFDCCSSHTVRTGF